MSASKLPASGARPVTPVMEDYLEAIFDLAKEKKGVRVKDIARRLGVKMPTVTSMLKTLRDRDLVVYEKYEYVELAEGGADIGREMNRRHRILRRFLMEVLKVEAVQADEEACKMEHAFSRETLDKLVGFMAFIQSCPRTGPSWLERFDEFRKHGRSPEKCLSEAPSFSEEFRHKLEQGKPLKSGKRNDGDKLSGQVETLRMLKPGERAVIRKVTTGGELGRRIREMGIIPGTDIQVLGRAPLKDPVKIKVMGYNLTLRNNEADHIMIDRGDAE